MRTLAAFAVLAAVTGAAVLTACSDPNALADATNENAVHTDTLAALSGTPLSKPSGFSVASGRAVRTDTTSNFDFIYDFDAVSGRHTFVPIGALGVSTGSINPGLKRATQTFDQIVTPDVSGYATDTALVVAVGDRFVVRSSSLACSSLGVPVYGKLEVLSLDDSARTIGFRVLVNQNCGYRSLAPGIPKE